MREVVAILCISMSVAFGILMLVFGCAYSKFQTSKGACLIWFVAFFYVLLPILRTIEGRLRRLLKAVISDSNLNAWANKNKGAILFADLIADFILFFTSGFVISSFAFPIILARAQIIKWGAVGAVWGGNIFILAAMAAFFIHLGEKSPKGIHIQLHDYTNSRSALWAILKLIGNSKSNTHPPSQSLTKLES